MADCIMIQGTMSNSGKSFVAAGLCRIFTQDGIRTAPFKSQNMSNNSFITNEGLEIGTAQALQAIACKIPPLSCMNPILLKPNSDVGSQVIVNGIVYGNMNAAEYYRNKKKFIPDVLSAYKKLYDNYDAVVIEGAGSPAEINLQEDDIVNMGLAGLVDAPVILVADIDRGGVFASIYGTVMLLDKEARERIKGIVINKFRGDPDILMPGIKMIEDKIGKKVIGIIPYKRIDIEDEDSLSERLEYKKAAGVHKNLYSYEYLHDLKTVHKSGFNKQTEACVEIYIIKFPHISNFNDFNVFERIENVNVRYIENVEIFENTKMPDIIILPGTKNTMYDLAWLKANNFENKIKSAADSGTMIIGICGGFQMLGDLIDDSNFTEHGGLMHGLGMLDLDTIFETIKTRVDFNGFVDTGCKNSAYKVDVEKSYTDRNVFKYKSNEDPSIKGYEIHMGTSIKKGLGIEFIKEDKNSCRLVSLSNEDGSIWGSYIHGLFENEVFTQKILNMASKNKIDFAGKIKDTSVYRDNQIDKLAELIRSNVDINMVYKILKKSM